MWSRSCHFFLSVVVFEMFQQNYVIGVNTDYDQLTENTNGGVQEYCLKNENFIATCHRNEVIIVNSAIYGRMKLGRCLEAETKLPFFHSAVNDPLFLGCSIDVLELIQRKCSGKNHCEIRGIDHDLQKEKPCHDVLQNYLEVDYSCVTVIEEDRSCVVSTAVTSNPLHIMRSSLSSSKLSCGTKSQPWRLEAPTGQQINISLLDFGARRKEASLFHSGDKCQQYGYIIDKSAVKKNVSLCGVTQEKRKLVYTSSSNVLEIVLNETLHRENNEDVGFLLRFTVVGCADLVPPENAWLRRNQNEAVVGCYIVRQTWHLRCAGNNWIGVMGNCTHAFDSDPSTPAESAATMQFNHSYEVLVIISIGFLALVICVLLICGVAVCLRRHYAHAAQKYRHKIEQIENDRFFQSTAVNDKNGITHVHHSENIES